MQAPHSYSRTSKLHNRSYKVRKNNPQSIKFKKRKDNYSISTDNRGRMNLVPDKIICPLQKKNTRELHPFYPRQTHNANRVAKRDRGSYFEKLSSYNDNRGSTISYFPVLKLGKFHQNLENHTREKQRRKEKKNAKNNVSSFTLAAGCSTSNILRIVAPSLVIVTSPMSSTSI